MGALLTWLCDHILSWAWLHNNPDVVWCSMCFQWVLVYTQCFPTQPHTISQSTRPCLTIFHMFSHLDCYWQTWVSVAYQPLKPWRSKSIGISFATTRRCHGPIAGVSGVRCSAMFSAFSACSVEGGGMQNSEPNWYKTHFIIYVYAIYVFKTKNKL